MIRTTLAVLATSAVLSGASPAQAGTHWSLGISVPVAGVIVSNGGGYYVQDPAPVYYAPAPRYIEREVVFAPAPVFYTPVYREPEWRDRWDGRRDGWQPRWDEDRREYRGHRDRHEQRWGRERGDEGYGPQRARH